LAFGVKKKTRGKLCSPFFVASADAADAQTRVAKLRQLAVSNSVVCRSSAAWQLAVSSGGQIQQIHRRTLGKLCN
jgi:hypothetical protein